MQEKIEKALQAAGLQYKPVSVWATDSRSPETVPAIMVYHDYTGEYPTSETWGKIYQVRRIAARHRLNYETRGYYSATLLYLTKEAKSA